MSERAIDSTREGGFRCYAHIVNSENEMWHNVRLGDFCWAGLHSGSVNGLGWRCLHVVGDRDLGSEWFRFGMFAGWEWRLQAV